MNGSTGIPAEFVAAVRQLLAEGWTTEGAGYLVDAAGTATIHWDWELEGAQAAVVAPPAARWTVELGRESGIRWRAVATVEVASVAQAVDVLVAFELLPVGMSRPYQAAVEAVGVSGAEEVSAP